jgi:hypothetical protein
MSAPPRVLERVALRAPLGLRLWDLAAGTHRIDGLRVEVRPQRLDGPRVRAFADPGGLYCALGLPGLRTFERATLDDEAAWAQPQRDFRIEIQDPAERFLPLAFDARLPARGLIDPLGAASPPAGPGWFPEADTASPPAPGLPRIPLFSAPHRPPPNADAVVYAELRDYPSGRPAAWCLLAARIEGRVCGLGLADRQGRIAVIFPYPARPSPTVTSPPSPKNDFHWPLSLDAYYRPAAAGTEPPAIPDLAELQQALAEPPRRLFESLVPLTALHTRTLDYRQPLILRTRAPTAPASSYLFVDTA